MTTTPVNVTGSKNVVTTGQQDTITSSLVSFNTRSRIACPQARLTYVSKLDANNYLFDTSNPESKSCTFQVQLSSCASSCYWNTSTNSGTMRFQAHLVGGAATAVTTRILADSTFGSYSTKRYYDGPWASPALWIPRN